MKTKRHSTPEVWDLYDFQRNLTNQTHQRGLPIPKDRYHLVVHVAIFNEKNQLLIQQRQKDKPGWANYWDLSAAGSALAGETSQVAGIREVFEELGLRIDLSQAKPRLSLTFSQGFDDYYLITLAETPREVTIQKEEVQDYRWVTEAELLDLAAQDKFIPYFFLDKLFALRNSTGFDLEPL